MCRFNEADGEIVPCRKQSCKTWAELLEKAQPQANLYGLNRPSGEWESGQDTLGPGFDPRLASPEYRDAFPTYLRRLAGNPAMRAYEQAYRDVLQVGISPQGGLLVPPDIVEGVNQRILGISQFAGAVRVRETDRDVVELDTVRPAASDFDVYSSNFIGAWVSEIPAATAGEAEPTFGRVTIPVNRARTKTFLTHDMLADPRLDVIELLVRDGGGNLGLLVDKALIVGTGVQQPLGILNTPTGSAPAKNNITLGDADETPLINLEGSTANEISSTTTDQASILQLQRLISLLPAQYLGTAKFLMHRDTYRKVRGLIDGSGQYIYGQPLMGGPNQLLGYDILFSDWMPQGGTDGNKVIVFGAFDEGYLMVRRQPVEAQLDPFSKTDIEQNVLYLRLRVGGNIIQPRSFVIGVV